MNDEPSQPPMNIAPSRAAGMQPNLPPRPDAAPPAAPAAPVSKAASGVSRFRFVLAMGIALLADTVGYPASELGIVVFDVAVGLLLALCLRGFRPEIIVACLIEAIPGVGLFPSWSLAVPALWARLKLGANAASSADSSRPR